MELVNLPVHLPEGEHMSVVCTAFREFSLAYRIAFLHSFNFRVPAEDTAAPEEHSRWGRIVSENLLVVLRKAQRGAEAEDYLRCAN